MTYQHADSSSIEAVAYDRVTSTLRVRFRAGGEYLYALVPEAEYDRFLAAQSIGRHFVRHIRNAGYEHRRVR